MVRYAMIAFFVLFASLPARAELPAAAAHDSAVHPITVFCDDEALAAELLAEAEDAWEVEVTGMGFAPPLRVRDGKAEPGFDVHIADFKDPNMLVTFEILGDIPETPRTDCATLGKMNQPYLGYPVGTAAMGLRHLFNHASLHAVDCIEPQMPSFDFVSVAVNVLEGKEPYFIPYYLKAYQSLPWAAIDYQPVTTPYYMFGTALFALFLEEAVGDNDGRLLARIWEHAAQDGHILKFNGEFATADVPNSPDFLAAIDTELQSLGTSLEAEYVRFAEWRYFLAGDADAAHFAHGAEWTTGKVARDATLTAASLPVVDAGAATKLAPTGMAYIELSTAGLPEGRPLIVAFRGNAANRWAARVLRIPAEGPADAVAIPLDDDVSGLLEIASPASYARLVLVVVNLGQGPHELSKFLWSSQDGDFTYGLALKEVAAPDDPAPIETGATDDGSLPDAAVAETVADTVAAEVEADAAITDTPAVADPGPAPGSRDGGSCRAAGQGAGSGRTGLFASILGLFLVSAGRRRRA